MKKLLLLFILFPVLLFAQQPISFSEVVKTDSVSKEILFNKGMVWFVNAFNDSKEVIQLKDEANGQIIGKALLNYTGVDKYYRGNIYFTVELIFKDGRYKYDFKDFRHKGEMIEVGLITDQEDAPFKAFGSTKAYRDREWKNMKEEIKKTVESLVLSMQNTINNAESTKTDNW